MRKLSSAEYPDTVRFIDPTACGAVYPLSIAQGFQRGDVFVNGRSAIFWHDAGFAFLCGDWDGAFLREVHAAFLSLQAETPRRFVLFAEEERAVDYFSRQDGLVLERRFFFEIQKTLAATSQPVPSPFTLRAIDGAWLEKIEGRITPRFSWRSAADFLEKGTGFCLTAGETVAAWAFSAAVSDCEIDIGVETKPEFRRMGLGAITAGHMIQACFRQGKRPVWACSESNRASARLAEKIGFEQSSVCWIVKRA